jgi:hypothetical protein
MKPWGGIAVCLALLSCAPAAQAAQRFAAPQGTGPDPCAQAEPCSLLLAIGDAGANDEVIVGTGTYPLNSPIAAPVGAQNLSIHGDPAGPRPVIEATIAPLPINIPSGGRLSYLEIDNSASGAYGAFCPPEGLLERIVLRVTGEGSFGTFLGEGCTARNSLIRVAGSSSVAVLANAGAAGTTSVRARNLTVIATGPGSLGLYADYYGLGGSLAVDAKNLIVDGGEHDLSAADSGGGVAQLTISHSIFDSTIEEGKSTIVGSDNQVGPALFAEPVLGDFHEASGSPSIDAGVGDLVGPLDLDGNPRTLGAAPDIGAFEFVPPPATLAVTGRIESLKLAPVSFRAAGSGGAVISAKKKKKKAPPGTRVSYSLSAAATVEFSVERKLTGRRSGRKCVKRTRANRSKKKCVRLRSLKGGFADSGGAGQNRLKFSGRLKKALPPGRYRLVGEAGGAVKRASFRIVR